MLEACEEAVLPSVGILEDLVLDPILAGRQTRRVELRQPIGRRILGQTGRAAASHAVGVRGDVVDLEVAVGERGVVDAKQLRNPHLQASAASRDHDVAVLGFEEPVVGRIDRRLQRLPVTQNVGQCSALGEGFLEVLDESFSPTIHRVHVVNRVVLDDERRLQQGNVQLLAHAGALAVVERRRDAPGHQQRRGVVDNRFRQRTRSVLGHRRHARVRLQENIHAGLAGQRAACSKGRVLGVDDAGIGTRHRCVVEAELLALPWPEIHDGHVCFV